MAKRFVLIGVVLALAALLLVPAVAQAAPGGNGNGLEQRLTALEERVLALEQSLASADSTIASLEARLSEVESNPALGLGAYPSVDTGSINDLAGPNILITGANLHIRSGPDTLYSKNGLGNLVIGYSRAPIYPDDPLWDPEFAPWFDPNTYRTGSHNLIVGDYNRYDGYSSIVGGHQNTVETNSAVLSGSMNFATSGSAVLSGLGNDVNQWSGAIVGDQSNSLLKANPGMSPDQFGAILGGLGNQAFGYASAVSGGSGNTASGAGSSVSGGWGNVASGGLSSVCGGQSNTASGEYSGVGGGIGLSVADENGWAAGN